ncbi:hypothetical protein IAT38_004037 [Cryptococcus sp. DSM 104549]
MVSFRRAITHAWRLGLKRSFRSIWYFNDLKWGRLVGTDRFGNRYYENYDPNEELPGRNRWVDFSQHDLNASQVPPEWHSWISHIRKDPPTEDAIMKQSVPFWGTPYVENLTGTRGSFKTYSTTAPKIQAWDPVVKPRGESPSA